MLSELIVEEFCVSEIWIMAVWGVSDLEYQNKENQPVLSLLLIDFIRTECEIKKCI